MKKIKIEVIEKFIELKRIEKFFQFSQNQAEVSTTIQAVLNMQHVCEILAFKMKMINLSFFILQKEITQAQGVTFFEQDLFSRLEVIKKEIDDIIQRSTLNRFEKSYLNKINNSNIELINCI